MGKKRVGDLSQLLIRVGCLINWCALLHAHVSRDCACTYVIRSFFFHPHRSVRRTPNRSNSGFGCMLLRPPTQFLLKAGRVDAGGGLRMIRNLLFARRIIPRLRGCPGELGDSPLTYDRNGRKYNFSTMSDSS